MGIKISALLPIVTPALTDVFPVVQGGVTYKETITQLSTLLGSTIVTTITGTPNEIIASSPTGNVVLSLPQPIDVTSSPTFANITINNEIFGANGLPVLHITSLTNAVNSVSINNQITGINPGFVAAGTDTNVGIGFVAQAAGIYTMATLANTALQFQTGTAYQHKTNLIFANTSATQNVTFPDASGTIALTSGLPTPSALTEFNDTNVTMTLGGTPATALLQAVSLTLGWTGTLSGTRGGTGVNNGASTLTLGGSLATSGAFASTFTMTGPTTVTFPTSGTLSTTVGTVTSVTGTTNQITSTGGATPVIAISASYVGQGSITTLGTITTGVWTGTDIALANGGTNASLTASNGGIFYSTASAGAILSGTATANQILMSGASSAPVWSTTTYPTTNAINTLLYASSANVLSALATANNSVLVTSSGGVPSLSSVLPLGTSTATATGTNAVLSNFFEKCVVNVLDHGIKFDGSTDDTSAWNTLLTNAADKTRFVMPWGTSVISSALTVPSGRHYYFQGAGAEKTIISTTSLTADLFTILDWQTWFADMSFNTSVTKSAGFAINFGSSNAQCYVLNCDFGVSGAGQLWNGVNITGTIATISNCNFINIITNGIVFNSNSVNAVVSECTMNSTGHTTANISILLAGSLLISDCDIIGGANNLLIAPTSSGAFGIYAVNTYFDSSTGSSVKVAGTSNTQRLKFTNCWFSGSVNGFEFAGPTGNTSTTAVDFTNCDFYTNSANGILATTFRDFSVTQSRFAGNTTAGINITANAGSAIASFIIANNTIGPTGQSTPGSSPNGTGIIIAAGTYLGYSITGNNLTGNTSGPLSDAGVITGQGQKYIDRNLGMAIGPMITQSAYSVTTTPVYLNNPLVLPANSLRVGSTYRITMVFSNLVTTATTTTILLKYGTAGTTGDTTIATVTATGTAVADNARVTFDFQVTALSATVGTVRVLSVVEHQATATGFANALPPILVETTTASLNTTTAANYLGIVLSTTTAAMLTLHFAYIEVINP